MTYQELIWSDQELDVFTMSCINKIQFKFHSDSYTANLQKVSTWLQPVSDGQPKYNSFYELQKAFKQQKIGESAE